MDNTLNATATPHRAPGLMKVLLEARAPLEYVASLAAAPWLLRAPRGDGHAVLVYPGFLASDFSTRPLRRLLRSLGHDVHGWDQGRNLGPRDGTFDRALQRIEELHRSSGRSVSLVGWSLGGVYARELAKQLPQAVRAVVTLGTPFAGSLQANNAWRTYQWVRRKRPPSPHPQHDLQTPPPVPTSSIYSRSDGIVAWQCSIEAAGPMSESIEVAASHAGLGVNPFALFALADRLAQPEGAWRPFDRSGLRATLYPDPLRNA
jgi:pimeloyl-ACP methyl ester carboxylesterase